MVELNLIDGELEDVSDEEERDEYGNPKFDPTRLNLERQNRTLSKQRTPPEHANRTNTNGGANVGNGANGGATETRDADTTRMRGRPLVELSREAWDKAKSAIIAHRCFLDEDSTREELLACRYLLYKEKMELRRLRL
jgi:hypothetical protein